MKLSSGLRSLVFWEATHVYCAFNVLEVDLLQHTDRHGLCKSGSLIPLGLWKSSRSRRGPFEA